jgi:uncharacterized protein (DUF2267 family)
MNHDEFVGQVQARAKLGSRGDAERIIRATLETLGERLNGGFADNIAAQLPPGIGRHLRTDTSFERLSLEGFFHRVLIREGGGTERPDAVFHARCVMEVLQKAVSQGLVEKLREVLPPEFEPLLERSRGRMTRAEERKMPSSS